MSVAPSLPAPGSIGAWVLAVRPKTLVAAAVPVLVGTSVAAVSGRARPVLALAALLGALFLQVGTNLANDVFDHQKGADTAARIGPARATQAGLLTAAEVRAGMIVAFGLAVVAGGSLAAFAGWPVVWIGIASIASGIAYTGGPWPLGYHGLGDLFVFAFFGVVAVCGSAFVQLGSVPPLAVWSSLPVGALATAILAVNNVRDEATDRAAGKRTLAVRFGRRFGVAEYAMMLLLAAAGCVAVAWSVASPWPLLPLPLAPEGVRLARVVGRTVDGESLNAALAGTARLLAVAGGLLAAGIAMGG